MWVWATQSLLVMSLEKNVEAAKQRGYCYCYCGCGPLRGFNKEQADQATHSATATESCMTKNVLTHTGGLQACKHKHTHTHTQTHTSGCICITQTKVLGDTDALLKLLIGSVTVYAIFP